MLIPDKTLTAIAEHAKSAWDFDLTHGEIQALCEEGEITEEIAAGWPDTYEREMFLDVLAEKFTGRVWPTYGEVDSDDFPIKFAVGYMRWKWGKLAPGDFVLHVKDDVPTSHRVRATSFSKPEEIVPGKGLTWVELEGHDGKVSLNELRKDENPPYEVIGDGNTVWVNNHEGVCLGRFSRYGIDIHNDMLGQQIGVQCLDCKPAESVHGGMNHEDWERFKAGMLRFHNVVVTDSAMPGFLR